MEPLAEDRDARQRHEDQLTAGGQGHRAAHTQDRVGAQLIAHADAKEQAGQEGDAQVQGKSTMSSNTKRFILFISISYIP